MSEEEAADIFSFDPSVCCGMWLVHKYFSKPKEKVCGLDVTFFLTLLGGDREV